MRGEHTTCINRSGSSHGSSPHARGAQQSKQSIGCRCGIIPACAGSTNSAAAVSASRAWIIPACAGSTLLVFQDSILPPDHPRMCGEHVVGSGFACGNRGSSPHARGAHHLVRDPPFERRIIPACAGSTHVRRRSACRAPDHPRMRGEHLSVTIDVSAENGSSPHARGALRMDISSELFTGIIPACAGSTTQRRPLSTAI